MSARVKRGTNITGKADRSASVPSVTNKKENSCGLLSPRKGKNQGGYDLKTTEQEKGAGWVWEGNQIILKLN